MKNKHEFRRRKINLRGQRWVLEMRNKYLGQKINLGDEK